MKIFTNKICNRCKLPYSKGYFESVKTWNNRTCKQCILRGGKINAHHIKSFALFPELRFAIDNGVTLCKRCHMLTDSWGGKVMNKSRSEILITNSSS